MQDSLRNQSWIRITFVIIALAAAAAVVIDDVRRSVAGRKLREAILAELQPVALKNCALKRFGSANDGGYLMCENLIQPLDTDTRTVLAQTTTGAARCRADIAFRCTNTTVSIQRGQSAMAAGLSFTTNALEIGRAIGIRISSTRWKTRLAKTAIRGGV
jgi:hypothetical protein